MRKPGVAGDLGMALDGSAMPRACGGDIASHRHGAESGLDRPDNSVVRQAAIFQMRLWSGVATDADHEACLQWRAANPAHELAWQRIGAIGERMQAVPRDITGHVLRDSKVSQGRRKAMRALGVTLAVGLVSGYSVRQTPAWQRVVGDHAMGIGQWGHVMLPDGTRVDLNTASAVDVAYTDAERIIQLRSGEILVTSAPDTASTARPLRVQARHGLATALGTRYGVREFDSHTQLSVFHGEVELALPQSGLVRRVPAGQCVDFDADAVLRQFPANENDIAWTRGLIIAERMPLEQFLAQLQRYRIGLLQCDPAIAAHPLTGVFSLGNTEDILNALQHGLPVRQQRLTRYWVRFLAV